MNLDLSQFDAEVVGVLSHSSINHSSLGVPLSWVHPRAVLLGRWNNHGASEVRL
jgi:hypothetical protein